MAGNKKQKGKKPLQAPEGKNEKQLPVEEKAHRKNASAGLLGNRYFPAIFSIAVIAVIIAGAFAIWSMNAPQVLVLNDFTPADTGLPHVAKIILLYSKDCVDCENDNSFLNLLEENKIAYARQKIEINSEDGKKLVSIIQPRRIPLVILDAKSLDSTMAIKTQGGSDTLKSVLDDYYVRSEQVIKWQDSYIIPEISFDERPHIEMLLDANTCGSKQKIQADLFTDPYCAPCALATASLGEAKAQYADFIDFNYNFFPIDARRMLFQWEQISPVANYSICASRQGRLEEFQAVVYKYYCAPDQNSLDLNSLQHCSESPNFHFPVPQEKLNEAIAFAGIDKTELGNCLEQIEKDKPLMISTGKGYGIAEVPQVVLNCRFVTHAENLKNGLCAVNPSLQGCIKP
ncbi:MAG: hypothetical protein PHH08_04595 [Candidatus ainarchaeum sp.]|nr:hypothetical protein [Candidatus ainarchaeum sp.]